MIHQLNKGYAISSYHTWRPGCYELRRAATYAQKFNDVVLNELQAEAIKSDGIITFEMLQAKRKELNKLRDELRTLNEL